MVGNLTINVDSNLPNIKIGINSYEALNVRLTGPYVGNVTQVVYAGYNDAPGSTITGVNPAIVSVLTRPAATVSDANGYPYIICNYSGGSGYQGGCNTRTQVQSYFQSVLGGSLSFHKCQYNAFSGTLNTSAGGSCG